MLLSPPVKNRATIVLKRSTVGIRERYRMSQASSGAPMNALPPTRRSGGRMGEGQRPEAVAGADEEPHPEITLRQISAWSLGILAGIAVGFLLYAAREVMLPVVAAFVVGIMLGPAARRREGLPGARP